MIQIKMRNGFSMITAIFLIVLMSTVAIMVFSLSGKMVQGTTIQYRSEQADLLARSYTELAVLAVLKHDRTASGNCVENIDSVVNNLIPGSSASGATSTNGGGYKILTRIYYIGNDLNGTCSNTRILNGSTYIPTNIVTNYKDGGASDALAAIIVDVYVRYKNPDAPNPSSSPWITYYTRRIVKI